MKPLPPYSDSAHQAITHELIRLCLPHPTSTERPELVAPLKDGYLEVDRRSKHARRTHSIRTNGANATS